MVDDVRNFLFALNRRGQDLSSINIQRGRDHGLPDLNTVRETIGLTSKTKINSINKNGARLPKEVLAKALAKPRRFA